MKNLVKLLTVVNLFLVIACSEEEQIKITALNSSDSEVRLVKIPWEKVAAMGTDKLIAGSKFSQPVDENDDGKPDFLAVKMKMEPNSKKSFIVKQGLSKFGLMNAAYAEISEKVNFKLVDGKYEGGEYKSVKFSRTPPGHKDHNKFYRFEGPGWESDLVGYRLYLDVRNSTDIFGKKVRRNVLPEVGHNKLKDGSNSYHEMQDWGMDIFKVGNSLGIGTIAAYENDIIEKVAKTDSITCKITESGPLTSVINLTYYGWKVNGKKADLYSTISINAFSRLTKQKVRLDGDNITIATGLAKHKDTEYIVSEKSGDWQYFALWGKQSLAGDDLGIVLFYHTDDEVKLTEDKLSHIVSLGNLSKEFEYYYAACWSGEPDGIKTIDEFKEYARAECNKLNNPVQFN